MTDHGVPLHGSIAAFCAQQRAWLELELQDEQEQKPVLLSRNGGSGGPTEGQQLRSNTALSGLSVSDVSIGLYGRTVVQFVPSFDATASSPSQLLLLPAHRFTTGDEVEIRPQKSSRPSHTTALSGVVSAVTDASLSVALFPPSSKQKSLRSGGGSDRTEGSNHEEEPFLDVWDNSNGPFVILARSNVQVHRKLVLALSELETKGVDHAVCGRIVQALFDPTSHVVPAVATINTASSTPVTTLEPIERTEPATADAAAASSSHLDASQQEAIAFALSSRQPLALIHGPVRVDVWRVETIQDLGGEYTRSRDGIGTKTQYFTDPFSFRMPSVARSTATQCSRELAKPPPWRNLCIKPSMTMGTRCS
jgi:hypothetical protein